VRQGDGTYVSSLEPDLLLESTGSSPPPARRHGGGAVRGAPHLEASAAALAAARIDEKGKEDLLRRLESMAEAESVEDLVEADVAFHAVISRAAGNANLTRCREASTRTMRVRLWRGRRVDNALDVTRDEHRRIYEG
jgi:GntR family transcriptional repressor for pyruvate dehydrogenase complex